MSPEIRRPGIKRGVMMKVEGIRTIGIVGAGLMGYGIAQVFITKGYKINLYDKDHEVLKNALSRIQKDLQAFQELKLSKGTDGERCLRNIHLCRDMSDLCRDVDVVIEAVSENVKVKQVLFAGLERFASREAILCTNTSGIRIGKISENLQFKDRVVGTHFWNPPHILPCVEVIRSEFTSEETFQTIADLMKKAGKEPVRVLKDIPGFLGNRLQNALFREALSLCQKGVADPEDIDRVVKYGFGSRLPFIGPFETMDLAGNDLGYDIQKYLFPKLCSDSKPVNVLKRMVHDGQLGVKTKKGFYKWTDAKIKNVMNRRDVGLLELIKLREKSER
jgi:3-hydroxybutyryl-CoA dehydrogenase